MPTTDWGTLLSGWLVVNVGGGAEAFANPPHLFPYIQHRTYPGKVLVIDSVCRLSGISVKAQDRRNRGGQFSQTPTDSPLRALQSRPKS
jgi:hypothetical protein